MYPKGIAIQYVLVNVIIIDKRDKKYKKEEIYRIFFFIYQNEIKY